MGRVFGILMLVIGVWIAAELYTHGMDGAFGGVFSKGADAESAKPITKRTEERVRRAFDESEERLQRALERSSE